MSKRVEEHIKKAEAYIKEGAYSAAADEFSAALAAQWGKKSRYTIARRAAEAFRELATGEGFLGIDSDDRQQGEALELAADFYRKAIKEAERGWWFTPAEKVDVYTALANLLERDKHMKPEAALLHAKVGVLSKSAYEFGRAADLSGDPDTRIKYLREAIKISESRGNLGEAQGFQTKISDIADKEARRLTKEEKGRLKESDVERYVNVSLEAANEAGRIGDTLRKDIKGREDKAKKLKKRVEEELGELELE